MHMKGSSPPRVLLVEDDAISREVLTHALHGVPVDVVAVDSLAAARASLATVTFDAWLVDAHLPDGHGRELLALRASATHALAHTAATDANVLDTLIQAGFEEVLVKPIAAADVQAAMRRVLRARADAGIDAKPASPRGKLPVWDDDAALRALAGNAAHVTALRGLFVRDLEAALDALARERASGDVDAIRRRLHKLRAGCGFVGAARVCASLATLDATPLDDAASDAFAHAVRDTLGTPDPLSATA